MTRAPSVGSDQAPDLALAECRPTAASGSNAAPGGHFQPGADGVASIVASGRAVIPGEMCVQQLGRRSDRKEEVTV
jgi:hypothetical protein